MYNVLAFKFENKYEAERARLEVLKMEGEELIEVEEAIVAVKDKNNKVKLNHTLNIESDGTFWGAWAGMLLGFLLGAPFSVTAPAAPLIGIASGSMVGAIAGDLEALREVKEDISNLVEPNSAALLVITNANYSDKLMERIKQMRVKGKVIATTLPTNIEQRLEKVLKEKMLA